MEIEMVHPDDVNAVRDWVLYGPRNAEIPRLVDALAQAGMRLDHIENLIESFLRERLLEVEEQQPD
jgi:hypothetical protein